MKFPIEQKNLEPIARLLIAGADDAAIRIGENDVDELFADASHVAFYGSEGANVRDALQNLPADELDAAIATKAIFVIRVDSPGSLPISDLTCLGDYLDSNFPTANVKWGLHSQLVEGAAVRIFAVTTR